MNQFLCFSNLPISTFAKYVKNFECIEKLVSREILVFKRGSWNFKLLSNFENVYGLEEKWPFTVHTSPQQFNNYQLAVENTK